MEALNPERLHRLSIMIDSPSWLMGKCRRLLNTSVRASHSLYSLKKKRQDLRVQLQHVSECLQLFSQTPSTLHRVTETHTSPSLSRKLYTSKRNLTAAAKHQKTDSIFSVWAQVYVSTITLKVEILHNWSIFTYL